LGPLGHRGVGRAVGEQRAQLGAAVRERVGQAGGGHHEAGRDRQAERRHPRQRRALAAGARDLEAALVLERNDGHRPPRSSPSVV
jgi:hypothetical protein